MIERFENDVLPFQPKILVIMGGVNDIRIGLTADEVIKNLKTLRDKCLEKNIVPVFCTLTPMNEEIMAKRGIPFKNSWKVERQKINEWIMQDEFSINILERLEDENGELRAELTPDGLHPALFGKMYIGKAVEKALAENYFNFITGNEVKGW